MYLSRLTMLHDRHVCLKKPSENTLFPRMFLLGPYNTSDFTITIVIVALIVMIVPLLSPYCPHRSPLLLLLCPYIIIVMSALIILWHLRLLYIERRFCHLYHPRIVHLCNVKEVSPSKRLIMKSLIYLFCLFVIWFLNRFLLWKMY